MSKRSYDETLERDLVDYLQGDSSENDQLRYEAIATALEQIIVTSSNIRFREKCIRLLLGDGGNRFALKDAILMRLHQQALNRKK